MFRSLRATKWPFAGLATAGLCTLLSLTIPSALLRETEHSRSHILFVPKALGTSRIAPAGATPPVGGTNRRWAGYVVGGQAYSTMSGSWTVPAVSYVQRPGNPSDEYSSAWIGIGGNADNDTTLVQLGTAQEASSSSSVPRYYAWYLFYGGLGQGEVKLDPTQYPVSPGDKITATIQCVESCTPNAVQTWTLTMTSSQWPRPWVSDRIAYKSSMGSAEWIMEATTVGGIIQQMPGFAPITFTGLSANGGTPTLSLADNGLTIADGNNNAIAIPTPPSGNSFTVKEVGIPLSQPLPTQPAHTVCTSGTDYGQLTTGVGVTPQGSLQGIGQVDYYRFFVTQYSFISGFFAEPKPLRYSYQIVDDLSGEGYVPTSPGITPQYELSLDPGYYCLKVFNPQVLTGTPYKISFSAPQAGIPPSQNRASPVRLTQFELGNLTHNGYFQDTRYLWFHNNPHPPTSAPLVLTPGHEYVLRDWVGPTVQNQWYEFGLDSPRNLTIRLQNLYEGVTATIETKAGGTIVAATTYDNAVSLGPLLPPQSYLGALGADTYLLHISFSGVGMPGTTFALSLIAQ